MGIFVVFEGVEGSGKSTQSRALRRRLIHAGCPTALVHEPGGTPTGERIRRWVKGQETLTPTTELFLFSAARASLVDDVIRPALNGGKSVVCDRYMYSTVAYQGHGRGLDLATIDRMNDLATGSLEPDLVVLLDLAPDLGFDRKAGETLDRIERERGEFHVRVRRGYLELSRKDPERWLVLDSSEPRTRISERIWARVSQTLTREPPK